MSIQLSETIRLVPLRSEEDVHMMLSWFFTPELQHLVGIPDGAKPLYKKSYSATATADFDANNRVFMIADGEKKVGMCEVRKSPLFDRSATMGLVIADKTYRGCGIGGQIIEAFKHIAFDEMNAENLNIRVYTKNKTALEVGCRLGFEKAGLLKNIATVGGTSASYYILQITRSE
ncbi:MAG: GNAT family N-acetyltransferase [Candidatus Lokiarchaeota archaeon]|nr:GNAT family N-acetyltransferase [Candidatus Lokiarchaeota archaeon]